MKEIKEYSLLPHNTFGMDVKASVFVEYGSVAELKAILSNKDYLKPSWLHIGGGSNLLFTADYEGTVLHSAIHGYEVVDENDKTVDIRVGAGEVWDDFVAFHKKEPPCKQGGPSGWDIGKLPMLMIRRFGRRVNRNLCHMPSNDQKILNFCE